MFNPSYTQYVLSDATITADGYSPVYVNYSTHELSLIINIIGPVTGTLPTLNFTIQEIDPGNEITQLGMIKTGPSIVGVSQQVIELPITVTGAVQITWTISGAGASFSGVYATLIDKITTPAIYDGYGNGPVSVKEPFISAIAADAALVMAFSPNSPLPAGSNQIGSVSIDGYVYLGSDVSITIGEVAQGAAAPLSGAWPVEITDGSNVLGTVSHPLQVNVDGYVQTNPDVIVTNFPAVQPVSGTVTANQGTSPWVDNITQFGGTTISTGTGASGAGIPRVTVSNDSNILSTQSGTWTVQPGNTANTTPWLSTINQGGNSAVVTASNALKVDGSAVTQPVSGTVTANAGTGSFTVVQATAANLNATVVGTVTANQGGAPWSQNVTQFGGNNVVTGTGASGSGIPRVTVSNDSNILATQSGSWSVTANAGTGNFNVVGIGSDNTANSTAKLPVLAAVANSSTPSYSSGNMVPLSTDTSGNLRVTGTVTELNASVSPTGATPPADATYIGGSVTTSAPTYSTAQMNALSLNTAGGLRVDGSGVTQPVSGTVTANAGTGSFTVAQATAANLNATVVGSGNFAVVQATASNLNATVVASGNFNNASVSATASAPPADATYVGGLVTTAVESGLTSGDMYALSLTTAGLLRTDGSNVTQPVSGTVTANQGGTWTVQPGNTANTTPWLATINQGGNSATVTAGNALKVDGSAVTQPVSGTVTANAGTGTFTVSGTVTANAGTGSFNNASVGATAAAPPADATYVGGLVTTAVESGLTNNDMYPLSMTTAGLLRTDGSNVTQPVSGTVTANAGTGSFTVAQATAANLNATVVGSGNFTVVQTTASNLNTAAAQAGTWTVQPGNTANTTPWLSTINQGGNSATVTAGNALKVDGSAVTQPVSGTVTSNAGTGNFTVVQATASNLNANVSGTVTSNQGTANTLANAWSTKITDATNGPVAVKPASTAAVATDAALVVAISPNNSIMIAGSADSTASGTLGAANATVQLAVNGTDNAGMQLVAGTLVGTIVPEISMDGGTTWVSTFFDDPSTNNIVSSIVFGSSNTATTRTIVGVGGTSHVRVRVSAYTSGTTTCSLRSSVMQDTSLISGGAAGAALPPVIEQVGGSVTTSSPTYSNGTFNTLSLNTAGGLRVDGSAVTQPVSGTVTANAGTGNFTVVQATAANLNATVTGTVAATQSGTWTVQPGNTANTTPWLATISQGGNSATVTAGNALKVDGSAVTQPVSGTVTANIGTTNGLALDTSVNGILVSQGSTTSGEKGPLVQGAVTTGSPTYSTAQTSPLSLTTAGALRVDGSATTQPVSGTVTANQGTSPWVNNITQFGGTNISTGTGASGAGIPRVTVSNDSNILSTQSGTWTVQPGNTANTTPWLTTINADGYSAYVTPPSTAAIAANSAMVITMSPNSAALSVVVTPSGSSPAIIYGDVTLNTVTTAAVERTTYTEQSTNFTGSIISSSANDSSAGTGARQVIITYVDQTCATKSTETVTLNGTTAVNLVATNKCFIESIDVSSVGSTGSNVGTISLYTGSGATGTVVGTIGATDNQTFWAHHYVITGKTFNLTSTIAGSTQSTANNGSSWTLKSKKIGVATAVETQINDTITLYGQSSQVTRNYTTAIPVSVGPARVRMYVTTLAGASAIYRGSFDFYE